MPKTEIVFTSNFDDTDSSAGDSEIEIIPYTKPPPVIIDLLEESENEEDETPKKKKKSKKKKSKKDKDKKRERDRDEREASEILLNLVEDQNGYESDGDGGSRVPSSHDVEPPTCSPIVVELSGLGSGNEATRNTTPTAEIPSSSPQKSNSVVSKDRPSLGRNDDGENVESTSQQAGANMVGTPIPLAQHSRNLAAQPSESNSTSRKGKGARKRTINQATQRTNEEISKFLTTLGIQMAAGSFDTPVRRGGRTRRRLSPEIDRSNITDGTTGTPLQSSAGFVSVTQENSSTPNRRSASGSPQGKRRRRAIHGDLSDFQVRITNQDLDTISTNIQSNIVLPGSTNGNSTTDNLQGSISSREQQVVMSSSSYVHIIDAVAKGLPTATSSSTATSSKDDETMEADNLTTGDALERTEVVESMSPSKEYVCDQIIPLVETASIASNTSGNEGSAIAPTNANDPAPKRKTIKDNVSKSTPHFEKESSTNANIDDEIECVINVPSGVTEVRQKSKSSRLSNGPVSMEAPKQKKKNKQVGQGNNTMSSQDSNLTPERGTPITAVSTEDSADTIGAETSVQNANTENTDITVGSKRGIEKPSTPRPRELPSILKESDKNLERVPSSRSKNNEKKSSKPIESQKGAVEFTPEETLALSTSFPSTWTTSMVLFYDTERNVDFELDQVRPFQSDAPEMWIAPEDLMRPPYTKRIQARCHRCKQLGHLTKDCFEPYKPLYCNMCGKTGHTSDHRSRNKCPEGQCLNCSKKLPYYAQKCYNCLQKRTISRCSVCNVLGHGTDVCPDYWRRYHSVNSPDEYEKIKSLLNTRQALSSKGKDKSFHSRRSSKMFCCNCAQRGHTFYDCNEARMSPYPRNKPYVVNDLPVVSSEAGDGRKSVVATIFDKKTGRTVLVNKDEMARTEMEVETIQVQFKNDLAETTKQDETKCKADSCTNKLKPNEKCYQFIIDGRAHTKLMKAKAEGRLKGIEELRKVQISIIPENFKIHIVGLETNYAEADLYRLLWEKPKPNQKSTDPSANSWPVESTSESSASASTVDNKEAPAQEKIAATANTVSSSEPDNKEAQAKATATVSSSEPPCITLEDDEDDVCVIEEIPLDRSKVAPPAEKLQKSSINKEKQNQKEEQQQQRRQSENTGTPNTLTSSSNKGGSDPRKPEYHFENKNQNKGSNSRHALLGEYRSPLAGFSLRQEGQGQGQYQSNPRIPPLMPPQVPPPPYRFDQDFHQVPPNPNPFFTSYPPPDPNPFTQFHLNPNPNPFFGPNARGPSMNPFCNPHQMDLAPDFINPFNLPRQHTWQNPQIKGPPWNGLSNRNPFDVPPPSTTWGQQHENRTTTEFPARNQKQPPSSSFQKGRGREKRHREDENDFSLLDDIEVIDHSNDSEGPPAEPENVWKTASDNFEILSVAVEDVEEEEDEDADLEISTSAQSQSSNSSNSSKRRSENVTLLQSEWPLVTNELMQHNNELNQIAEHFEVDLMASKESNKFLVCITKGSISKRRRAKDNVVSWLENKSSNTPFQLLPRGNDQLRAQSKQKRQLKSKLKAKAARALLLKDADALQKKRAGKKRKEDFRKSREEQRKQKTLERERQAQQQDQPQPGPSSQNEGGKRKGKDKQKMNHKDNSRESGGSPRKGNRYFNNNLC